MGKIRLDKYLADMSIGTRQEVKKYIRKKGYQKGQDFRKRRNCQKSRI